MAFSLNKEQLHAVEKKDCSLLIVAGAGTGKTKVLVEKILYLLKSGVSENSILALTFTNKAAEEMRGRISKRNLFVGTFHSFCVSLLREFYEEANIPKNFVIFDSEMCRRIIKRCMKVRGVVEFTPRLIQDSIGKIKSGIEEEEDHTAVAKTIAKMYEAEMEKEKALDFDDLIIRSVKLLKNNEKVSKVVRSRYKYILVDEFQDTDSTQNELVSLLKDDCSFVIAVGDTDQTIYSWRGADIKNMLSFEKKYSPSSTIFLTQNYRSTGNIINSANAVISKNIFRQEKDLFTEKGDGETINILESYDEEDEGENIAKKIIRMNKQGVPYGDIAILFRANFQARALETNMIKHNIPYMVLGTRFFDRQEVKGLLAYLNLIQNPHSYHSFVRASKIPRRGIGERTLEKIFSGKESLLSSAARNKVDVLRRDIERMTSVAKKFPVQNVIREMVETLNYEEYLHKTFDNPKERMYEVLELISFADRFSHLSGEEGINQLLSEVALSSEQDSLMFDKNNTVRLMTIHSSKGLEFPNVFIAGMEEGLFPFLHDDGTDTEEERRLCYVAMTRAKERLFLSFAKRRGVFGKYSDSQPSSFLYDIPDHLLDNPDSLSYNTTKEDIEW